MMQRPTPHPAQGAPLVHFCKEAPGPFEISTVWARADKRRVDPKSRHPLGEAAIFGCIFFRREVPAAAPGLITNSPVPHLEGLAVSASRSKIGERRGARRRVAVLN